MNREEAREKTSKGGTPKMHLKSTNRDEGFRGGMPLDTQSMFMVITLCLYDGGDVKRVMQEDGSAIFEITGIDEETKIIALADNVCGWGDQFYEIIDE